MSEIDYQLALLLQHQFEQEYKKSKEHKSDVELARTLQEHFQAEYDTEKPCQELAYKITKNKKTSNDSSKCLTDPSWEVIDPTPDIHMLFVAFDERFFWRKLLTVCVSWSKKMTSCAGICSYQGRGGMCSITLSEPLLKLRPRKDLVETLLHEMIHAYLFVTHNNKDRDGHGPEFQKHMYRINGEAGTNITVYHAFHEEVRLYQQHWWRCDGPCQKWKPYFGMVRRAMNRAPGPQDRWWGEHSRKCGGIFIKVKEPEKPLKKRTINKETKKPAEDIRKFIPSLNITNKSKTTTGKLVLSENNEIVGNMNTTFKKDNNFNKPTNNSNIFGFSDLHETSSSSSPKQTPNNFTKDNFRGTLKNNSNTIVITKKPSTSTKAENTVKPVISPNTTKGKFLNDSAAHNNNLDYSVVRNHWLNKYSNAVSDNNSLKRSLPQIFPSNQSKFPKLSSDKINPFNTTQIVMETVDCPVCRKKVDLIKLNDHLDTCLGAPKSIDEKECIICEEKLLEGEYELHISKCFGKNFDDDVFEKDDITKCTFCEKNFSNKTYNDHIVTCSKDYVENMESTKNEIIDLTCNNLEKTYCDICEKSFSTTTNYHNHVEKCLLKMYDNMEVDYGSNEEKIDCLACGENILKSELNLHLEDCMCLSRVFEDDNEPKESKAHENDGENEYNCPFCMKLILAGEMNFHIDTCLDIVESTAQTASNKSNS